MRWVLWWVLVVWGGCGESGPDSRPSAPPAPAPAPAPRGDIAGVVVDQAGARVGRARVALLHDGDPILHARADKQGRFAFRFPIRRTTFDFLAATYAVDFDGVDNRYGRLAARTHAGTVEDVAAGTQDITLRVEPIDFGGKLVVRVVDPDGDPVEDARVTVDEGFTLHTDTDGRVRFAGLLEHAHLELFVGPPSRRRRELAAPREQGTTVKPGGEIRVAFRKAAPVAGTVRDAQGAPVRAASVAATSGARHLYTSSTDERGRFELVIAADETEVSIRVGATVVENVAPGVRDLDIRLR